MSQSARALAADDDPQILVGASAEMAIVVDAIAAAAADAAPVLVEGEHGTGRERVARAIHHAGRRSRGRFVTVAGASLPRAVLDEELGPGLVRAHGGTLCIKDVGALPRGVQRELVRLLRRREREDAHGHDVRLVATTDEHLGAAVDAGAFEPELFERLAARRIVLPPLRRRVADLPRLVEHFVSQVADELHVARPRLHARAMDRLAAYSWPGNVGELKAVLRTAVVRAGEGGITAGLVEATLPKIVERLPLEDLALEDLVRAKLSAFLRRLDGQPVKDLHADVIGRVERVLVGLVLEDTGGHQVRAAEMLGLNRNTLRKKLGELGLLVDTGRKASAGRAPKRPRRAR